MKKTRAGRTTHRVILEDIARREMCDRDLLPDFSPEVLAELEMIKGPAAEDDGSISDLTGLLWASIDNDDSLDIDQLTVAGNMEEDDIRIRVAIADVDSIVRKGSAIDGHARHNTTSVYTPAIIFPMLPEKLSIGITSLNFDSDRPAIVVDMVIGTDGSLKDSSIFQARVRNRAKLAYDSVAAWLEGDGELPKAVAAVDGLDENLRIQDKAARRLRALRHSHGALSLETIKGRPTFEGDNISGLKPEHKNSATNIIEDFMIAANGVTARFLASKNFPSIRRVVRKPKRWDKIVMLAGEYKYRLPADPDPKSLNDFLVKQKAADPLRFPDLSLTVIKLLGPGEYAAEHPGDKAPGHFGLAARDYAHSTAPNRRYPDLITQRLVKAALAGGACPYSTDKLDSLARHCSEKENDANKVERLVGKSAAALLLESKVGEQFDSIVTGASEKGTWVRLLHVPVEGKLVSGAGGLDVGARVRVQLLSVDVERGFIDLKRVSR
ncbi:MAG: RNB domain-containing ribonuclease [Candidatus Krumholzibacteriota bacterium]|nr:RNB domain-containing ribonuclease [Candidatus Krumholzibacteriota bacterium]